MARTKATGNLKIEGEDKYKTDLACDEGSYQYQKMLFGLMNDPVTFQRALEVILSALIWKKCVVYLEYIVIFSMNVDDHIRDVDEVVTTVKRAGINLNLSR